MGLNDGVMWTRESEVDEADGQQAIDIALAFALVEGAISRKQHIAAYTVLGRSLPVRVDHRCPHGQIIFMNDECIVGHIRNIGP